MDMQCVQGSNRKKNLITKTWQRCRPFPGSRGKSLATHTRLPTSTKEKSKPKLKVAPQGCFWVYVGAEKQRFVIKTTYANHPLFKMLLEDAEMEYGFISDGPILLPCDVNLFYKVLAEMDDQESTNGSHLSRSKSCGFAYGSIASFSPTPTRKGFGSYGLLTPSRLIKMNSVS
ncbi:auxin-responsive protein SAUR71-like [Heracleum sosnowskyi]|uniref:Auxin-responsive protein SAUR71-like n=1 Tax=Heracleum sosnowskyi TaxID=360622 RepID=A0AAD8H4P1_9APIA|nr:auxin-responsive protein SAUR71-like [Heracleum sosnowskyi]